MRTRELVIVGQRSRTFVAAATIVLTVALVATLAPARRASRVDPTVTLRSA